MNAKTLSPTQKLITTNTGSQYIINSGVYVTTPQAPINPSTLEDCFLDTSDVGALNELKSNLDNLISKKTEIDLLTNYVDSNQR